MGCLETRYIMWSVEILVLAKNLSCKKLVDNLLLLLLIALVEKQLL